MSQYDYTKKPNFVGNGKDAYDAANVAADERGWIYNSPNVRAGQAANPEVLVAIRSLASRNTDALVVPTFTAAVTYSALAAMVTGDILTVTLTSTEGVSVDGLPLIAIDVNGTSRYAEYSQVESTATSLVFNYTVVAADVALATQVVVGTAATGGTVSDILPAGGTKPVAVTFVAPDATTISIN